ncbi:hypothetical protein [Helicobacter trogontum]|nr:hypothetical protein [Helicobacter trogontum]
MDRFSWILVFFALQSLIEIYNPMRLMSFRSGHPAKEFLGNYALTLK